MSAAYEVYEHPQRGLEAASQGFNFVAFLLPGPWALLRGLWRHAIILLLLDAAFVRLASVLVESLPFLFSGVVLLTRTVAGFQANQWFTRSLQGRGYLLLGLAESASARGAVRNVEASRAALVPAGSTSSADWIDWLPRPCRAVANVARLTVKSAVRFRVVQFLAVVLIALVVAFPLILRHDGTAHGLTQIILTYSMGSIITILCFATFWLAVGNLAREVEDGQIQMMATKPISFWKILLGKWLGIMSINLSLLLISAVAVQSLIQLRAQGLNDAERTILNQQILTARVPLPASLPDFDALAREKLEANQARNPVEGFDRNTALTKIRESLVSTHQGVMPNQDKAWLFPAGTRAQALQSEESTFRVRFQTASSRREPTTLQTGWIIGDPFATNHVRMVTSLTTDTYHELPVPAGLVDTNGNLQLRFANITGEAVVFDINTQPEILVRESTFETNVFRAFGILFCWLGLAAAVGLAAASKLNFNVAVFFTSSLVLIGMFDGTITTVTQNGTIWAFHDAQEITLFHRALDATLVPVISFLNLLLRSITDYAPIEALSMGRSVTWFQLGTAVTQCWFVLGGLLTVLAVFAFNRRELANPWQS